ncbi:MAG: porin [Nitrosomonadaceae bacterium]|nr:porin [Nitrosospira sp.]MDW7564442.1 porin [Nitrosomonadaceae bacterium]MBI0409597.1 porin [Nitrosospira sp.]MBI0410389.1 porin [Nitrosospira sp.]MBI0412188.1 porin [Nitrosospira sp.]
MQHKIGRKKRIRISALAAGGVALLSIGMTGAQAAMKTPQSNGMLNSLIMPKVFKDNRIEIGGWMNGGATFNPSHSTYGYNGPVTFGDRANQAQLNQFNIFLKRDVVNSGKSWDLGFRADFMFGTDAIFTQAYGNPTVDPTTGNVHSTRGDWDLNILNTGRNYGVALPQAFVEIYAPIANGLTIKAGHFYTPIGFESVPAPNNFFYSHAYTMQYGEPFTHTGVLTHYNVDKNIVFMSGAITGSGTGGWDGNFNRNMSNWGGIGGITYTTDDKRSSLNIAGTGSHQSARNNAFWGMFSVVAKHMITPKTHFILQHDHGYADNVLGAGQTTPGQAQWYGINTHLYQDVLHDLSIGVRGEWFRDRDGFRVWQPGRVSAGINGMDLSSLHSFPVHGAGNLASSQAADYYAITIGANWKPAKRLKIDTKALQQFNVRPNIRYDRADSLTQAAYRPFGGQKDQVLFSMDFTLPF